MDCLCTKFGYFGFCRFEFIVRTDRQTDRITDADDIYTQATTVGVSGDWYTDPLDWWTVTFGTE